MTVKIKPEPIKEKWSIVSVIDGKSTPIQGIEAATEDAVKQFIEEETTLLREYCEAHSSLTIVGFYLYSRGITNSEAGADFVNKWRNLSVKIW